MTSVHEEPFRTAIEVKSLACDGGHAAIEAEFLDAHIGEFKGSRPQRQIA